MSTSIYAIIIVYYTFKSFACCLGSNALVTVRVSELPASCFKSANFVCKLIKSSTAFKVSNNRITTCLPNGFVTESAPNELFIPRSLQLEVEVKYWQHLLLFLAGWWRRAVKSGLVVMFDDFPVWFFGRGRTWSTGRTLTRRRCRLVDRRHGEAQADHTGRRSSTSIHAGTTATTLVHHSGPTDRGVHCSLVMT